MTYSDIFLTGAYAFILLLWVRCTITEKRIDNLRKEVALQRLTMQSMSQHLAAVSDFSLKLHCRDEMLAQLIVTKLDGTSESISI